MDVISIYRPMTIEDHNINKNITLTNQLGLSIHLSSATIQINAQFANTIQVIASGHVMEYEVSLFSSGLFHI